MPNCWYIFNGVLGGELNPVNYAQATVPPTCPGAGCCICAVLAPNCGGIPTNPFPAALAAAINNAMALCANQSVGGVVSVLVQPC